MDVVIENPDRMDISIEDIENTSPYVIDLDSFLKIGENTTEFTTLLILNQKINISSLFFKLWSRYDLKICADGAANMLYEFFTDEDERSKFLPHYIIGDLDSIREDVLEFYSSRNVIIIKQCTQYSTDFTKCANLISLHFFSEKFHKIIQEHSLEHSTNKADENFNYGIELERGIHSLYDELLQYNEANGIKLSTVNVLTLNAIGGRFDQTIHSLTQLYSLRATDPYLRLIYLTETDIIFLIPNSGCLIKYDENFHDEVIGNCGILPIGGATTILRTKGLKWDVENWATSIATGHVSSSNRIVARNKCYIDVKDAIVLSVEIKLDRLIEYVR